MIRAVLGFIVVLCSAGFAAAQEVTSAPGGTLRALDKTSGDTLDVEMIVGQSRQVGRLQVLMSDCRYPTGNPSGNAYALLEIVEAGKPGTLFSGWMIASSPALSSMEHPRYDVWVIRCNTS
ncbi:MAG: DUF2155 domain-containing protein [Pseudomonadota bacterium]